MKTHTQTVIKKTQLKIQRPKPRKRPFQNDLKAL